MPHARLEKQPFKAISEDSKYGIVWSAGQRKTLVTHITVLVPDDPQEVEAESQEGGSQQVAQRGQVWDRETVRIFPAFPHGVNHPVRNAKQQEHLGWKENAHKNMLKRISQAVLLRKNMVPSAVSLDELFTQSHTQEALNQKQLF